MHKLTLVPLSPCLFIAFACFSCPTGTNAQSSELTAVSGLIRQEKLPEAERRLSGYLQSHPRSPKGNELLGTLSIRQRKFQQAEKSFQKAIALDPALLTAHIGLGDAYLEDGKLDAALAAYQAALKLAPHDARANLSLAKLYLGTREYSKSLGAAQNIPPEKRTPELLPTLAADYFGLQQPEKAGVEIQAMLSIADKQPDLVPELAEFFLAHRDFKSSQQLLSLAKEKQPATDRFLIAVAQTQAGLAQLDEAQTTLEGVLSHKPDSVEALVAAGNVAGLQSNWDAASQAFSLADRIAPNRPEILYALVTAQLRSDQTSAALANAQKLHRLAAEDLRATYVLALASFGAKKLDEAKRFAAQVLAAHPDDREMNLILVHIALNDEHDLPAARTRSNAVLRQFPEDPSALYYQGMIEKIDGNVKAAIQALTKSVAANAGNADAQAALGALCLQTGDILHAVPALEQAVLLSPEQPQNHYQLALAYTRAGAPEKAKPELEKYQQLKAKEAKDTKDYKGPSTSEVPSMGINPHP